MDPQMLVDTNTHLTPDNKGRLQELLDGLFLYCPNRPFPVLLQINTLVMYYLQLLLLLQIQVKAPTQTAADSRVFCTLTNTILRAQDRFLRAFRELEKLKADHEEAAPEPQSEYMRLLPLIEENMHRYDEESRIILEERKRREARQEAREAKRMGITNLEALPYVCTFPPDGGPGVWSRISPEMRAAYAAKKKRERQERIAARKEAKKGEMAVGGEEGEGEEIEYGTNESYGTYGIGDEECPSVSGSAEE